MNYKIDDELLEGINGGTNIEGETATPDQGWPKAMPKYYCKSCTRQFNYPNNEKCPHCGSTNYQSKW